jgi:hypothetical protein
MSKPAPHRPDLIASTARFAQILTVIWALAATTGLIATPYVRPGKFFAPDPWSIRPDFVKVLGFAALVLAVGLVVPGLLVNSQRKAFVRGKLPEAWRRWWGVTEVTSDAEALRALYLTRHGVRAALVAVAAIVSGFFFMMEGKALFFVATLAPLGVLLARFPTRAAAEAWFDEQASRLERERFLVPDLPGKRAVTKRGVDTISARYRLFALLLASCFGVVLGLSWAGVLKSRHGDTRSIYALNFAPLLMVVLLGSALFPDPPDVNIQSNQWSKSPLREVPWSRLLRTRSFLSLVLGLAAAAVHWMLMRAYWH